MKIGILTYHRTHNYGGCLQAFATRIVLEQMGNDVYYVDYWPEYHRKTYSLFSFANLMHTPGIKRKIQIIIAQILYGANKKKRAQKFEHFISTHIEPRCRGIDERYDAVVYGSDQIWRKQHSLNGYNPVYFANNSILSKRHIAFSASMGILPQNESEKLEIKRLLGKFNDISVRESELLEFVKGVGVQNAVLTLDPTLLLPKQVWLNEFSIKKENNKQKYVLVYSLHEVFNNKSIKVFAKNKGCVVKTIYGSANHKESSSEINTAGPQEFLSLIYNADYVFSSSFHGLVFSLIFEKEFFVSFDSNAGRALSLLELVGLQDRFIAPHADVPSENKTIDFLNIKSRLKPLRDFSISYLSHSLYGK